LESAIKNLTSVLQVAGYEYLLDDYSKKIDRVLRDVLKSLDEEQVVSQLVPNERANQSDPSNRAPSIALNISKSTKSSGFEFIGSLLSRIQNYGPMLTLFVSITLFQLAVICTFGINI